MHSLLHTCILWCWLAQAGSRMFENISDHGVYGCEELQRWSKAEKHYSNEKRASLFALMTEQTCRGSPVITIRNVKYENGEFSSSGGSSCHHVDQIVVAFFSNYSINHNFSHFMHALIRLFCALLDAQLVLWNESSGQFVQTHPFVIWMDRDLKIPSSMIPWLHALNENTVHLSTTRAGNCRVAEKIIYGNGCVKLLPPEKWFGYAGCRSKQILPAFSYYMRNHFSASMSLPAAHSQSSAPLRIVFGIRANNTQVTGQRQIANLQHVQNILARALNGRVSISNITFEQLNVKDTVIAMSEVHVFVSVHGAGMTNTFFMNRGAAVVEIIPYPLCSCRSPDYFYGMGGYYHGSSLALGLKHYSHCVSPFHTKWKEKPKDLSGDGKCSWRHLHAVDSVDIDVHEFVSLMRRVQRELVADDVLIIDRDPIITLNPHANG